MNWVIIKIGMARIDAKMFGLVSLNFVVKSSYRLILKAQNY